MAYYDPSTGQWYEYKSSTFSEEQSPEEEGGIWDAWTGRYLYRWPDGSVRETPYNKGGTYTPSELIPVAAPSGQEDTEYVDPTSTSAAGLAAKLLRTQFAEWETTFKPIELNLANQLSFKNPEILPTAINKATGAAESTYRTLQGTLSRQNAAMGVAPSAQQQATSRRLMDLSKALAVSGAANIARENVRTQDEQILMGATPSPNIVGSS